MLYYRDNHLWVESNVPMCVSELAWKNMWRQHTATEHAHVNVFSSGGGEFMICKKIIHEQLHETNRVRLEVEVWLFLTYFPPQGLTPSRSNAYQRPYHMSNKQLVPTLPPHNTQWIHTVTPDLGCQEVTYFFLQKSRRHDIEGKMLDRT